MPPDERPQVIDPAQGWLAQWNNVPSAGWTNGDSEALERATGSLHRVGILQQARAPSREEPELREEHRHRAQSGHDRAAVPAPRQGQARPRRRLKTDDDGGAVLTALRAWNGCYDQEDDAGTVDPGRRDLGGVQGPGRGRSTWTKIGATGIGIAGKTSNSHMFDITNGEAAALRKSGSGAYAKAAAETFDGSRRGVRHRTTSPRGASRAASTPSAPRAPARRPSSSSSTAGPGTSRSRWAT